MTIQGDTETGVAIFRDENRMPATDWNSVDWRKAGEDVRRLRQRIFRAERLGNARKVRSLQRLMLRSYSNRLMAVRRVTQFNRGKHTPGVDQLTIRTPAARGRLVDSLSLVSGKSAPVRRVYIPKSDGGRRPLGIPVISDRALQAVVKNALEPQWEARFENCSYGFRPGRSAHDAIELIFVRLVQRAPRPWVIDADIRKAFDRISHEFILTKLDKFPARELIRRWLKAGVVESGGFLEATEEGTPQGGVISPLLANIALDGMEEVIPQGRLVRYADDFVIFCKSRGEAEAIMAMVRRWLSRRGLELSDEKTRIVHVNDGFDFLGFNVRQYATPWNKSQGSDVLFPNPRDGNRIFIKPSKCSQKRHRRQIKDTLRRLQGSSQLGVIGHLNPIIRGWANYYSRVVSARVFGQMDKYVWELLWKWARRRHGRKGHYWIAGRYWGMYAPHRLDRWVFGCVDERGRRIYLLKHGWVPIRLHSQVRLSASPDDPDLRDYWDRRRRKEINRQPPGLRRTLHRFQKGLCPHCGEDLKNGEVLHVHHKVPKHEGGSDHLSNLQSVHLYCHQQIHSQRS